MFLWLILEKVINFFLYNRKCIRNFFESIKLSTLNNKITYYAIYNTSLGTYNQIHNYNTLFYILYYILFPKTQYTGMTLNDYEIVTQFPDLIIIISYIKDRIEYHKIYNNYGDAVTSEKTDEANSANIVYAYSYSCGGEENDLTNLFVKYKSSIFKNIIHLNAQHIYNILTGQSHKYISRPNIYSIKYMLDIDCEEKIII